MRSVAALSVLAAGVLTGCAADPRLIAGNEAGGLVDHAVYGSEQPEMAFAIADAHCHQFGKVARISGRDEHSETMSFDCVAPSVSHRWGIWFGWSS
jgi:hypothetical protein